MLSHRRLLCSALRLGARVESRICRMETRDPALTQVPVPVLLSGPVPGRVYDILSSRAVLVPLLLLRREDVFSGRSVGHYFPLLSRLS